MLVEIRRYQIHEGRLEEFVRWFETEALPAMTEAGVQIVGTFVDTENPDVFVYLKAFESAEERERLNSEFYGSDLWLDTLRDRALEMEESYQVSVVQSTPGSPL